MKRCHLQILPLHKRRVTPKRRAWCASATMMYAKERVLDANSAAQA